MRKVKFPFDLDVTQFLTDDLKAKVLPTKDKIISVTKERDERAKIRRKVKAKRDEHLASTAQQGRKTGDAPRPSNSMAVDQAEEPQTLPSSGTNQLGQALSDEEELAQRAKEAREVDESIDDTLRKDPGCNASGLYELVGIVTHKGAAADAGHYISWVKKDDDDKTESGGKTKIIDTSPTNEEWYKVSRHWEYLKRVPDTIK